METIKISGPNEIVYKYTHSNGFTSYIWPSDLSNEINLTLTVKYGSIHTSFKKNNKVYKVPNGIAHFLEHIKFNEKKDVTAHDFFYQMGSYTNAYTTFDHTCYEVVCTNNIKENLNHLLYFVNNPYFTKNMIAKEKGIIIEEAKSTLDNPYNVGYFKLMENIYVNDNKKHLITGTPEEIKTITLEDVQNVFDNFYTLDNMFLIVSGNINPFEIEKILDEYFENNKLLNTKGEILSLNEPNKVNKKYEEINVNVSKEKIMYALKIPRDNFKNYTKRDLIIYFKLLIYSNTDTTSEFNNYLIKNNLIDDLYSNIVIDENHITVIFEISTSYTKEVLDKLDNKIKNLTIDEETFERKRKTLIASSILGYEDPNGVNNIIRSNIIKFNKILDDNKEYFDKLKYSKIKNIIKNMNNYEISVVILKPLKNSVK